MLLTLRTEEVTVSGVIEGSCRSWKRPGEGFSHKASKKQSGPRLDFSPVRPVLDF